MANEESKAKPRVRKTAPTIRERAEAEQAKVEKKSKPGRIRPVLAKAKTPFKKVKRPSFGWIPSPIKTVGRKVGKVLSWLAPRYFVNAWRELRLVVWPSRRETWRLTGAVFIFATVFGAAVFGVDKLLDTIFKHFVLK